MLNQDRIKLMTKLASFEAGEGKTHLTISKYYRSDFIGLALIKNFFTVTIAFIIILGIVLGYYSDFLLDNVHKMDVTSLFTMIVAGYVVLLVFYSIVTYVYHSVKYGKAKKSVQRYFLLLSRLNKMYEKEENKAGGPKAGRR